MTKSLHRHYRRFRERMTAEIGLQTLPENRHWRCRRDVQRQSVPQSGSSDRKARSPMVERRVRRTTSDDVEADRRRWRASSADDWWSSSARYSGAVWCRHLYTRTASLNSMWSSTSAKATMSGVAWCGRTLMQKTQAEQQNLTLTASAWSDGMECQSMLRYHSPTAAERETTPVTVEWSVEPSDEYSTFDAESQNRQL